MNKISNFEQYINEHGRLIYTFVGVSMLPLLRQGKDLVILKKKNSKRCKKGDVVLYHRNKQHVLHRIIEVRSEDYVILGDNCISMEYGVTDDDIIGIMTGYVRNGKEHNLNELGYKIYLLIWLKTISIRIFLKKSMSIIKNILKHE